MTKLTVEEVLDKKYVTDAGLAYQLAKGEMTLDDQIIKDHVYQIGAYIAIYGSNDEILYTSADGQIIPNNADVFGAKYLQDESTFDSDTKKGIIKFATDVTIIGDSAFYGCGGLTSIEISDSVTSIGNSAFGNCSGLTSISYEGTMSEWNAITKVNGWNNGVPATAVHCVDGDVDLTSPSALSKEPVADPDEALVTEPEEKV